MGALVRREKILAPSLRGLARQRRDWGSVLWKEPHSLRLRLRSATSLREGGKGAEGGEGLTSSLAQDDNGSSRAPTPTREGFWSVEGADPYKGGVLPSQSACSADSSPKGRAKGLQQSDTIIVNCQLSIVVGEMLRKF